MSANEIFDGSSSSSEEEQGVSMSDTITVHKKDRIYQKGAMPILYELSNFRIYTSKNSLLH